MGYLLFTVRGQIGKYFYLSNINFDDIILKIFF